MRGRTVAAASVAGLWLGAGCFHAAGAPDAGSASADSGMAAADAGAPPDAGSAADAGTFLDAGSPEPDAGTPGSDGGPAGACGPSGQPSCSTAADCPNATNFTCDPATNCCVFQCTAAADCGGPFDPGDPCAASTLGCTCTQGVCRSKPCTADSDCPAGLLCKGGICAKPDAAPAAGTVVVEPNPALMHVGVLQRFSATLLDANGRAVLLAPGSVVWSVSPAGAGSFNHDATGESALTPANPSAAFGDVTVTATVSSTGLSGAAIGTIYAAPAAGAAQLTLIDAQAGLPVTDATVAYSDGSGNLLSAAVGAASPLGVYALPPSPPAGAAMLNVFEASHADVSLALGTVTSQDLLLLLPQDPVTTSVGGTPAPVAGGLTGDFTQEPGILDPTDGEPAAAKGDIHFAVAGTALPADFADFSPAALFGPDHLVTINVGGSHTADIPLGVEMGFGTTYFACGYDALGPAGGCGLPPCANGATSGCLNAETDPTQADWASSAFACGLRPAWGIGGSIPFSQIAGQLGGLGSSQSALLGALLQHASGFASAVDFQVPYTLAPQVPASSVTDACTGQPETGGGVLPDPGKLNAEATLSLDTPVGAATQAVLPPLPAVKSAPQQEALVLAGAFVRGEGFVPLGLAGATTLSQNGTPSANGEVCDTAVTGSCSADGNVWLSVAPRHGGLEGGAFAVVAVAYGSATGTGPAAPGQPVATSGLVARFDPSQPLPAAVQLGGTSAPAFVQYAGGTSWTAATRTIFAKTWQGEAWLRFAFQNDVGKRWLVYTENSATGLVLPVPPSPFSDPTLDAGGTTSAEVSVAAIAAANPGIGLGDLVDFGRPAGTVATDLSAYATGWSNLPLCTGSGC